jgi:hypothetical protein
MPVSGEQPPLPMRKAAVVYRFRESSFALRR